MILVQPITDIFYGGNGFIAKNEIQVPLRLCFHIQHRRIQLKRQPGYNVSLHKRNIIYGHFLLSFGVIHKPSEQFLDIFDTPSLLLVDHFIKLSKSCYVLIWLTPSYPPPMHGL